MTFHFKCYSRCVRSRYTQFRFVDVDQITLLYCMLMPSSLLDGTCLNVV